MNFEFPNEMKKLNGRIMHMSEDERRNFERDRYNALKTNTDGIK
jgi:hypothetical protein